MDRAESTALLREARAGRPGALDALYTRVAGRLLPLIRLRLGPRLRAQLESGDVLQATLLKSFQHIDQFEGADGTSLMAWLARIAEHEIRDRAEFHQRQRRDAAREVPIDTVTTGPAAPGRSALSEVILDEESLRLERALETLSPTHREVILLRSFEERTFGEIGRLLGRSEDACRMLYARAMAALTLALGGPA
jgi:RNA polymerase sigma-70 factor (ECF subfamily)